MHGFSLLYRNGYGKAARYSIEPASIWHGYRSTIRHTRAMVDLHVLVEPDGQGVNTTDSRLQNTGRRLRRNSPANRIPSHGTALFGLSYAIDFVPVDETGRSAAFTTSSVFRPEPPTAFVGFGRPITAPIAGTVMGIHDTSPDHAAYRGFPSVGYALTQRKRLREGLTSVLGNHVLIEADTHTGVAIVVVLCHLQQASVTVQHGQQVRIGETLGRCGNSGNSTEPHLHLHTLDGPDLERSAAVPITFNGQLPHNKEIIIV